MNDEILNGFNLVGDTSLALRIGHRQSEDLDLFTRNDFDTEKLKKHLIKLCDNPDTLIKYNNLDISCIKKN